MSLSRMSKASALMTKESWEKPTKQELKRLAQGVAAGSAGLAIGSSVGYAINEFVMPKFWKSLGPKEKALVAGGVGLIAGLGSAATLNRVIERASGGKKR